jgi:2'-5' RNA ligase
LSSSGLVLLTPALDDRFGDLRAVHDPAARQGMPAHATTLYPFMDPKLITGETRARLAEVIARLPRLELTFARLGRFPEALWLAPEPAEPLIALTRAIAAAFPDYPPYGGQFETVIPHVTIAMGEGLDLGALEPAVRRRLSPPVVQPVASVSLFTTVQRRWREVDRFELG